MKNTWQVIYNHPTYGECLERLVMGTKERAEEIAAELSAQNGRTYWVEDGNATYEAFKD